MGTLNQFIIMESEFDLKVGTHSETRLPKRVLEDVNFRRATRLLAGGPFKSSSSRSSSIHSSRNLFATPPETTKKW